MKERRLALQLAALEPGQRRQLLAELPAAKRAELEQLLEQIEPLVAGRTSLFERMMVEADLNETAPTHYDDAQLTLLLSNEGMVLRHRLATVFADGREGQITAHVQGIIRGYLLEQAAQLPAADLPRTLSRRRWWKR